MTSVQTWPKTGVFVILKTLILTCLSIVVGTQAVSVLSFCSLSRMVTPSRHQQLAIKLRLVTEHSVVTWHRVVLRDIRKRVFHDSVTWFLALLFVQHSPIFHKSFDRFHKSFVLALVLKLLKSRSNVVWLTWSNHTLICCTFGALGIA